ncbi:MAG TPA: CvpA family protein [Gammaproteobacteria bacterium]|nr:CvpA family protein [Gammaproteobacteria bacterium]
MVWIDYFILAVVVLSILLSLMRGFVREAISLGTWIAAFWLALTFASQFSRWFTAIESDAVRIILAFGILFVAVLIVGAVLNHLVSALVDKTGLSGTDRLLGAVFGFGRGLVFVAALVIVAQWTQLPKTQTWQHSRFMPYVDPVATWLRHVLPIDSAHPEFSGKQVVDAATRLHSEEH